MKQKQNYNISLSREEIYDILSYCSRYKIKFIFNKETVYLKENNGNFIITYSNNDGRTTFFQTGSARSHQFAKAFKFNVNITADQALSDKHVYDTEKYCKCIGNIKKKVEKLLEL